MTNSDQDNTAIPTTDSGMGELIVEDVGAETEFNEACCIGSVGTAGSIGSLGGCVGTAFCIGSLGSFCAEA